MVRSLAAGLAFFAAAIAVPASAEPVCGERAELLGQLETKYSEAPAAAGLSSDGGIVEVLTSPAGDTWTIILTLPSGLSCLVVSGEGWATVPRIAAGHGA